MGCQAMSARRFHREDPPEDPAEELQPVDGVDVPVFPPAPPRRHVGVKPPPAIRDRLCQLRAEFAERYEKKRREAPGIWI